MTKDAQPSAAQLSNQIRSAARQAQSEEDLRISVEQALIPIREQLGIKPSYERSYTGNIAVLGSGSSDAVYGHVIIEYKKPGRLSKTRGVHEASSELERYLTAEAHNSVLDPAIALRRMIGVGLDGESIFFYRYRGSSRSSTSSSLSLSGTQLPLFQANTANPEFQIIGPYPVTEETVSQFLVFLRALSRRPLTPDALVAEFGPSGAIAGPLLNHFYNHLIKHLKQDNYEATKIQTLYAEWNRLFGITFGEDVEKAKRDVNVFSKIYELPENLELKPLLFVVHTYYALFMKLLAAELASLQRGSLVSSILADLISSNDADLRDRLRDLEDGGLFARLGITNFLEGDFFGWYLNSWDQQIAQTVRELASRLAEFEPATGQLHPEATRDLLKQLYQYLIPKELRHDLGEYYTPDWLAEQLLSDLTYNGEPDTRILDPACGSGTFLVLAINRALSYSEEHLIEPRITARKIVENIAGFDLNPLAVIAARTNYLLALGNLVRHIMPLEIPVYLADSILTPSQVPIQKRLERQKDVPVPSIVGTFWVPRTIVNNRNVGSLTNMIETSMRSRATASEFCDLIQNKLNFHEELGLATLKELYERMILLESEGKDGIWTRIIKNAFAPVYLGKFDYIVGNPPWVNWESLARDYREATRELWSEYGLFSLSGHEAQLGGGKKDVSMLMLYACIDNYLVPKGKLGFVITQTLFKSSGAGDGFRRFRLGSRGETFAPLRVDDLSELQPFEGTTNRTALVVCQSDTDVQYPVPYYLWRKSERGKIPYDASLENVLSRVKVHNLVASPVDRHRPSSPWLSASGGAVEGLRKAIGRSLYEAHAGSYTGGLNGAYWLHVIETRPDGYLLVENLADIGKTKTPSIKMVIEPDLVYPLLRGRDVKRWSAEPSASILLLQNPQTKKPFPEQWLRTELPRTFEYISHFEGLLRRERKSRMIQNQIKTGAFYAMYAVAGYTVAPNKVVWREQSNDFAASVAIGQRLPLVPDHKLMLVAVSGSREAYYLSGVLNSVVCRAIVKSYSSALATSTHVLSNVRIPTFDRDNPVHKNIENLAREAEAITKSADTKKISPVEKELDQMVASLFDITDRELSDIRHSLDVML